MYMKKSSSQASPADIRLSRRSFLRAGAATVDVLTFARVATPVTSGN